MVEAKLEASYPYKSKYLKVNKKAVFSLVAVGSLLLISVGFFGLTLRVKPAVQPAQAIQTVGVLEGMEYQLDTGRVRRFALWQGDTLVRLNVAAVTPALLTRLVGGGVSVKAHRGAHSNELVVDELSELGGDDASEIRRSSGIPESAVTVSRQVAFVDGAVQPTAFSSRNNLAAPVQIAKSCNVDEIATRVVHELELAGVDLKELSHLKLSGDATCRSLAQEAHSLGTKTVQFRGAPLNIYVSWKRTVPSHEPAAPRLPAPARQARTVATRQAT